MENRLCPMKFAGMDLWRMNHQDIQYNTNCEKEKCAWWDEEINGCDPNKYLKRAIEAIWELLYHTERK